MNSDGFVIKGDFCCRAIPLLNLLLMRGEKFVGYGKLKIDADKYVWYFKMSESLREFLEGYFGVPVIWDKN